MPTTERDSGIVVIQPVPDFVCAECGGGGDLLRMQDAGPLCLACSDLDHLVFLPSGDAALTRRAPGNVRSPRSARSVGRGTKGTERRGTTRSAAPAGLKRPALMLAGGVS